MVAGGSCCRLNASGSRHVRRALHRIGDGQQRWLARDGLTPAARISASIRSKTGSGAEQRVRYVSRKGDPDPAPRRSGEPLVCSRLEHPRQQDPVEHRGRGVSVFPQHVRPAECRAGVLPARARGAAAPTTGRPGANRHARHRHHAPRGDRLERRPAAPRSTHRERPTTAPRSGGRRERRHRAQRDRHRRPRCEPPPPRPAGPPPASARRRGWRPHTTR